MTIRREHENITSVDECVRLTFDDVLAREDVPRDRHDQLVKIMNTHGNRWKTTYFLRGPSPGIRELFQTLLRRRMADPRADGIFHISVPDEGDAKGVVTVLSRWGKGSGFHPTAVWRSGNEFFLIDYPEDLDTLLALLERKSVIRQGFTFADQQGRLKEKWAKERGKLHCNGCKNDYSLEACGECKINEENGKLYVIFRCPSCQVNSLDSL